MPIKLTTDKFKVKAINIHGNKYDYSLVDYTIASVKINIICHIHGIFSQTPNSHIAGSGCLKCGRANLKGVPPKSLSKFLEDCKIIHGDVYDYSKVEYKNSHTSVKIICKEHGEFKKTPSNHIGGSGCTKCKLRERGLNHRLTHDEFIERAINIHGNYYDYSKSKYIKSDEKIIIICPTHGEFSQCPSKHMNGGGCSFCGKIKSSLSRKLTTDQFIEKAIKLNGDRYNYSKVSCVDSNTPVSIVCKIHGTFKQTPYKHLFGRHCRKCSKQSTPEYI